MFQANLLGKDVPNKSTMSRIISKFCQHGTVCNLPYDREKTALTPRALATVSSELALNDPGTSKSLHQVVHEHRNKVLSYSTTHCATEALGLHPYKVRVIHELLPLDYDHCVMYCQWLLNFVQTCPGMLSNVFNSDEARFQLSEYVKSQNNRVWSATNPYVRLEAPLHPEKIGVCCAISEARVVEPFFYVNDYSEVYLEITDFHCIIIGFNKMGRRHIPQEQQCLS